MIHQVVHHSELFAFLFSSCFSRNICGHDFLHLCNLISLLQSYNQQYLQLIRVCAPLIFMFVLNNQSFHSHQYLLLDCCFVLVEVWWFKNCLVNKSGQHFMLWLDLVVTRLVLRWCDSKSDFLLWRLLAQFRFFSSLINENSFGESNYEFRESWKQ